MILADLIRWRWTKLHSDSTVYTDSTVPITSGCSYLLDVLTDKVALIRFRKLNIIFEDRWAIRPSSRLFSVLLKCEVDRRVATTNDKYKSSKDNQKRLPKMICIPETKRDEWIIDYLYSIL